MGFSFLQWREDRKWQPTLGYGDFFPIMNKARNIRKMISQISNRRSFHMRDNLSQVEEKVKVKVCSERKFLWNLGDQKTARDSGIGRGQLGFIGLS